MNKFDSKKFLELADLRSAQLNAPLEASELAHLEKVATQKAPSQLVELLEIANGQHRHFGPGLFGGQPLESAKDIAGWIAWHHEEEQGGPSDCFANCPLVQQGKQWQIDWIPITYSAGGVFLYIDCAPSSQGTHGQVILSSVNTGKCGVVARDLNELITFSLEREELITDWPMLTSGPSA